MPLPTKLLAERSKFLTKKGYHDFNDCSVKAVAIACNVSYAEAHKALERLGRKRNRGAYKHQVLGAIGLCGCKYEALDKWKGKTTKTLSLPRKDRYLAMTVNHAIGVQFGLVKDYSDARNFRVQDVYKVTKRGKQK